MPLNVSRDQAVQPARRTRELESDDALDAAFASFLGQPRRADPGHDSSADSPAIDQVAERIRDLDEQCSRLSALLQKLETE